MFSVEIHVTALGQHLMVFRSKILKGHMFSKILWPPIVSFLRGQETSASGSSNRNVLGAQMTFVIESKPKKKTPLPLQTEESGEIVMNPYKNS